MTEQVKKTILVIPEGADVSESDHPYADEIREDAEVTAPKVRQEIVRELGSDLLARDLVSQTTQDAIATASQNYADAEAAGDTAGQISALEELVDHLTDITTGKTLAEHRGGA